MHMGLNLGLGGIFGGSGGNGWVPNANSAVVDSRDLATTPESSYVVDITGYSSVHISAVDVDTSVSANINVELGTDASTFLTDASYKRLSISATTDVLDVSNTSIAMTETGTDVRISSITMDGLIPDMYPSCFVMTYGVGGSILVSEYTYTGSTSEITHLRILTSSGTANAGGIIVTGYV